MQRIELFQLQEMPANAMLILAIMNYFQYFFFFFIIPDEQKMEHNSE